MSKVTQEIYLTCTYGLAFFNIVIDFELIKSVIIFIATMILLIIQIKLHLKRLRKEDENEENENPKKN